MAEVRVVVRVRPGASRTRVGGAYGDDALVVAVSAAAVDGAANAAVVRAVADALGLRPRQVSIVRGRTARSKVLAVEVDDVSVPAVRGRIDALRSLDAGRVTP